MKSEENFKKIFENYQEAKKWLLSLIGKRHSIDKALAPANVLIKFYKKRLETTKKFLKFLGNPQNSYKTIHIAGTSGKGSTTLILSLLLKTSGLKVGTFIKPYLQEPIERLQINLKPIKPSKFISLIFHIKKECENFSKSDAKNKLSYLQLWPTLAFYYFKKEKVDLAVVEALMGGRFDYTNVTQPEVSIITTINYDHVKLLGPSLENIAWHKAGIIKKNTPVIVGDCPSKVFPIIEKEAKEKNAPLYTLGKDFFVKITNSSEKGIIFDLKTPFGSYKNIQLPLQGKFQAKNFALAFMAYKILQKKYKFSLKEPLNKTLTNLKIPGRMEIVQKNPTVLLDAAHNPEKIKALVETIKANYKEKKEKFLVIGILKSKDASSMLAPLSKIFKTIITTQPQVYGKTPVPANELEKILKKISPNIKIIAIPEPKQAVKQALKIAPKDSLILITGSLYLVGNVREIWHPSQKLLYEAEKEKNSNNQIPNKSKIRNSKSERD